MKTSILALLCVAGLACGTDAARTIHRFNTTTVSPAVDGITANGSPAYSGLTCHPDEEPACCGSFDGPFNCHPVPNHDPDEEEWFWMMCRSLGGFYGCCSEDLGYCEYMGVDDDLVEPPSDHEILIELLDQAQGMTEQMMELHENLVELEEEFTELQMEDVPEIKENVAKLEYRVDSIDDYLGLDFDNDVG